MNIWIASFARAGGVEVPLNKLDFSRNRAAEPRRPGLLRRALGRLFQGIGRRTLAAGERLLAAPAGENLQTAPCR